MILVLDNRDSFVYNLARYVRELGGEVVIRRSDEMTIDEVEALAPSHIVISPGPCTPAEAGISTEVVRRFGPTTPIPGVASAISALGRSRPMTGHGTSRFNSLNQFCTTTICRGLDVVEAGSVTMTNLPSGVTSYAAAFPELRNLPEN